jgi:hypothetical protein
MVSYDNDTDSKKRRGCASPRTAPIAPRLDGLRVECQNFDAHAGPDRAIGFDPPGGGFRTGNNMPNHHEAHTSHNRTMKALIIYDNFTSAARASTTLQNAAHRAEISAQWDIKPWSIDALSLASAADEALTEAADADLIVFAGRRPYVLPAWLKDWLECWATRRQVGDAALAVMCDGTGAKLSAPAALELRRFAARHDLSFIANNNPADEDDATSIVRNLPARRWPPPSTLEHAMPGPSQCCDPHWGIND